MFEAFALAISIVALILSGITAVFAILAWTENRAARLSTHRIEYVAPPTEDKKEEEEGPPLMEPGRPPGYPDF